MLLVDDDPDIGTLLSSYLQKFDIHCQAVTDGEAMNRALAVADYDVILLDVMLPGDDGLTLLRQLRETSNTPVIMLTARGEFADKVFGLESGADDYLVKPFDTRELVARIQSVLRRSQSGPAKVRTTHNNEIRFNNWRLNCVSRQLTSPRSMIVPLSNAEYRLLRAFLDRPGRVLSRDQLLDFARGRAAASFDRSIDLLVSRLRQKLEDDPRQPHLLKTVRGEGYMLQIQ
ncbi:MAG: response regulator transcription factor [Burkholderiales bacterium]|nr:response regulator transcription factor [Burkholderiales bacterium]